MGSICSYQVDKQSLASEEIGIQVDHKPESYTEQKAQSITVEPSIQVDKLVKPTEQKWEIGVEVEDTKPEKLDQASPSEQKLAQEVQPVIRTGQTFSELLESSSEKPSEFFPLSEISNLPQSKLPENSHQKENRPSGRTFHAKPVRVGKAKPAQKTSPKKVSKERVPVGKHYESGSSSPTYTEDKSYNPFEYNTFRREESSESPYKKRNVHNCIRMKSLQPPFRTYKGEESSSPEPRKSSNTLKAFKNYGSKASSSSGGLEARQNLSEEKEPEKPVYKGSIEYSELSQKYDDKFITCTKQQASKFLDLVAYHLEVPQIPNSDKEKYFQKAKVANEVSITKLSTLLGEMLRSSTYYIEQLRDVNTNIHKVVDKKQLKDNEVLKILLSSKISAEDNKVDKDKAIFALTRSMKYVLLK